MISNAATLPARGGATAALGRPARTRHFPFAKTPKRNSKCVLAGGTEPPQLQGRPPKYLRDCHMHILQQSTLPVRAGRGAGLLAGPGRRPWREGYRLFP